MTTAATAGPAAPTIGRTPRAFRDPATLQRRKRAHSFRALMVLSAIMFLSPQAYFPVLAPARIALVAAVIALATLLFERFRLGEPLIAAGPEIRWGLAFVAWSVVTVPFSVWRGGSVEYLADFYLKNFVLAWLISGVVHDVRRMRQVVWGFSLFAGVLSVMAIYSFGTGQYLDARGPLNRISVGEGALTGNPNDLALLLNIVLPLTVTLLVSERSRIKRLPLMWISGLAVAAVVTTFSRGGFVTLCVSLVLLLWRVGRRRGARWALLLIPLTLAAVPLLPDSYQARINTITDIESDPTGSSQQRWQDMSSALTYIASHPLMGSGIGNNVLALNDVRGATWVAVHNVYLQVAVELGFPGLLLFLAMFVSCLRAAAKVAGRPATSRETGQLGLLAQGVWISLAGFAVAAVFHPVAFHAFFYFLAGLAIAARNASGVTAAAVAGAADSAATRPRPPRFAPRRPSAASANLIRAQAR